MGHHVHRDSHSSSARHAPYSRPAVARRSPERAAQGSLDEVCRTAADSRTAAVSRQLAHGCP
ncbi:hypothetical protein ACQEVS_20420 [Streptomyces sp. CA-181903]|uniref:hypothetical protein n=1 Tax=Streptomyces sp. CA-181903 TaxID=3240055 RepID=UPI003D8F9C9B